MLHSHCLGYGGVANKKNHSTGGSLSLFPQSFWPSLVWETDGSIRSQNGESMEPKIMVQRIDLHDYMLQEYARLQTGQDENALDDGGFCRI